MASPRKTPKRRGHKRSIRDRNGRVTRRKPRRTGSRQTGSNQFLNALGLGNATVDAKQARHKKSSKQLKHGQLPSSDDALEETCFEQAPMSGDYIFVPKGDVYITRHCRSKTKSTHQIVYVVYNKTGKYPIGIRVPADIHAEVTQSAAETADLRANAVKTRDAKDLSRSRDLLQRQFPLMPAESLDMILDHAFLKGSGRVGRSTLRTEERKAGLAVEAHIRHLHTPYEELLDSGMDRDEARENVWETVQGVKTTWEGTENNHQTTSLPLRARANPS